MSENLGFSDVFRGYRNVLSSIEEWNTDKIVQILFVCSLLLDMGTQRFWMFTYPNIAMYIMNNFSLCLCFCDNSISLLKLSISNLLWIMMKNGQTNFKFCAVHTAKYSIFDHFSTLCMKAKFLDEEKDVSGIV